MNFSQAVDYIHSVNPTFCNPGLRRIRALCHALGNPEKDLSFIHVAGTNGKGSFCAMLSSILTAAGYRVGRYTSPYIKHFCERISIGNRPIPQKALTALVERVRPIVDAMEDPPTEFELITALGFLYFKETGCDIVVLECGLGGRMDATNIISSSVLSVITGIALDHTAFLGDTHAAIAREKAGILRAGVPALWCGSHPEADAVIREEAARIGAPLYTVDRSLLHVKEATLDGTAFSFGAWHNLSLPLLGSYQPYNASNVLRAVELLIKNGYSITPAHVRKGLAAVKWPARFELLSRDPIILADGGHNPDGVRAAVESIRAYFGTTRVILLSGLMADKDYEQMADDLASVAACVFCVTPPNPRALPSAAYAEQFHARGVPATACSSVSEGVAAAYAHAVREGLPLCCLGSLYLYGAFCDALATHLHTKEKAT